MKPKVSTRVQLGIGPGVKDERLRFNGGVNYQRDDVVVRSAVVTTPEERVSAESDRFGSRAMIRRARRMI